jgi:hypothetical protein
LKPQAELDDVPYSQIRGFAFATIRSSTILLPRWRQTCVNHNRPVRIVPRDVKTRWNSVLDMAVVAVEYRELVDEMTGDKALGLRRFELGDDEWELMEEMIKVLKVWRCLYRKVTR